MKKPNREALIKLAAALLAAILQFIKKKRTKKEALNESVTFLTAGIQAWVAYEAFNSQVGDSDDHTKGLSVGMFLSLTVFNGVNAWLGFSSLKHPPLYTSEKILKFVQYLFAALANFVYFAQCIYRRKMHGDIAWHSDDSWQICIILVGYALFIWYVTEDSAETLHETILKSISTAFRDKIKFGFLMGFTVLIAHGAWGLHILHFGTQGVLPGFLKFTLISIICRFCQNAFDMWADGTDSEKISLLMAEAMSLATWIGIMIVS